MMQRIRRLPPAELLARWLGLFVESLTTGRFRQRVVAVAFLASALAAAYWGLVASDRYVSEAHVIIQRTDIASGETADLSNLLGNTAAGIGDQLLLRDYLLSLDMLRILDGKLGLRAHYSNWRRDPLSRLWFDDAPIEKFQRHFRSRVSVDFDEFSRVLIVRAQAYDPETAQAIAQLMVAAGEKHMNAIAHDLARVQVDFLEKQVAELSAQRLQARQAVLEFQNRHGLASPQGTVDSYGQIVANLQSRVSDLQTRRAAMLAYLMPGSPAVREVEIELAATEKQLQAQQQRLASPSGETLNRTVEEFQRLQANAEFAEDIYKSALVALEKGRIEAVRTLKRVSVMQQASLPEYPLQPQRIYNSFVFFLVSMMLAGVIHLIAAIIRDHRD